MTSIWMPQIDRTRCIGCKHCVEACPTKAITQFEDKTQLSYPERCIYCAICEDVCPVGAIELPYLVVRRTPGKVS